MEKESLRLTELLEAVRTAQDEKLSELTEQLSVKARNEAELEARLHGEETKRKNLEREVESLTENRGVAILKYHIPNCVLEIHHAKV